MALANIGALLVMHFLSSISQSAVVHWYVWTLLAVTNFEYLLIINILAETFVLFMDFLVCHFSSSFSFLQTLLLICIELKI